MPAHLAIPNLKPGILITAGVSGGPDSLAMLLYLHGLHYPLQVASFNHGLRAGAEADVEYVRQVAANLGLPFATASADAAAHAAAHGLSIEEAARELRYRFLFSAARQAGAQAVAVGHTADDQAETVLMHFLRGAGLSGLKGMPPSVILTVFDAEIPLVRPLLYWTRVATEDFCREHGLQPRLDPTNTDTHYFRNRLRHELLPILAQYNPQIRQTLARTALALQGDHDLLDELTEAAWQSTVRSQDGLFIEFDASKLSALTPALARSLFRRAAFKLRPGLRDVDFDALGRAASLKPVDLAGGLKTCLEGSSLYLTTAESALPSAAWPQLSAPISLLGSAGEASQPVSLGSGWNITCQETAAPDLYTAAQINPDKFTAWLDAEKVGRRLLLRPVRTGDRFEPLGMPRQTVKLADLFINLKIPKRLRSKWPLLCVEDVVAWVPGLRFAETFKVTANTLRAVKITLFKSKVGPA